MGQYVCIHPIAELVALSCSDLYTRMSNSLESTSGPDYRSVLISVVCGKGVPL